MHHSDSLDIHLSPVHCQLFGRWTPFSSVDTDLYSSEVLNKRKTLSSVEEVGESREDSADVFKCGLWCLLLTQVSHGVSQLFLHLSNEDNN